MATAESKYHRPSQPHLKFVNHLIYKMSLNQPRNPLRPCLELTDGLHYTTMITIPKPITSWRVQFDLFNHRMRYPLFVLIAATCAVAMVCGCQHIQSSGKKSILAETFLGTGFEPETAFRHHGFVVEAPRIRDGAIDLVEKCNWASWQGVVTVPGETNACLTVAKVIRDELNRALGTVCKDELTTKMYRFSPGHPFWGSLYHDEYNGRADVRVWLIPHDHTSSMSYVIYLRALELPKSQ